MKKSALETVTKTIEEDNPSIDDILGYLQINPEVKDTYVYGLMQTLVENARADGYEEGYEVGYDEGRDAKWRAGDHLI